MKSFDFVLISLLSLLGIIGIIVINVSSTGGDCIYVYENGTLDGIYSLDEDRDIHIETDSGGVNDIAIRNKKVLMSYANCPDKVCVNQGAIMQDKESICCAPNGIIVLVASDEEGEYDAITQ